MASVHPCISGFSVDPSVDAAREGRFSIRKRQSKVGLSSPPWGSQDYIWPHRHLLVPVPTITVCVLLQYCAYYY